jgi:hypothetical protein
VRTVADLVVLERETEKEIVLALEPEPACMLETTDDAISFFERELWSPGSLEDLARRCGLDRSGAEQALRRHLGICLDTCHASVEFESPRTTLARLLAAGIRVPKIQLSAALELEGPSANALAELRTFDDGVYLHQAVLRRSADAPLERFLDLDQALAHGAKLGDDARLRVHFHVPIFEERLDPFASTQSDLADLLRSAPELAPHLEVETYTFGVLPARYRSSTVAVAVAREIEWAKAALAARA